MGIPNAKALDTKAMAMPAIKRYMSRPAKGMTLERPRITPVGWFESGEEVGMVRISVYACPPCNESFVRN